MVGLSLTLFNNLPFELWNLKISSLFLIIATVLSIYSGIEYYKQNKLYILSDTSKLPNKG